MRALAIVLATVAVAAIAPATANAGTYHVKACFHLPGYGWVGNGSWWPDAPTEFATAYTGCPGEGIVARMTGGPGSAGWGAGASHVLAAPPGTRIVRFTGSVLINEARGWHAGLADATRPAWVWCGGGTCSTWGTYQPIDVPLDTTRLHAQVVCGSTSCARDHLWGTFAMRDAVVTIADDTPPSVRITGGLSSSSGWLRGNQEVQFAASDGSGIRNVKAYVDERIHGLRDGTCTDFHVRPCRDESGTLTIPADAFGQDGRHVVTVRAWDGAENGWGDQREVWTDRTAPAQPTDLGFDGSDEWRSTNRFTLRWTNPTQNASPVAAARYRLCPETVPGGCVEDEKRGRNVRMFDDLRLPGPGGWRLTLWLEDEAGNHDTERSATIGGLRFDDGPPVVAFLRANPDDPARVTVAASDAVSGIAATQIDIRRRGDDVWRTLAATPSSRGSEAVIDDEALPEGDYDLRAHVVDRAGNERSTQNWADGSQASMSLPIRVPSRVVVGKPTRVRAHGAKTRRYRIVLDSTPRTRFGRTIPLTGRLTLPGANPLASADLEVWEQFKTPSANWQRVGTVRTSRRGRFRFKALRGPSRLIRFRYPGTRTIRGRTAEVELGVRATTSVRVSRRSVVNGAEVTFRGRLKGGHVGDAGKLVQLQVFARGGWLTFATPRARSSDGRWSHRYRFAATRGHVRYRFRAWVPRETGYPFESGASRRVEVSVRGL